MYEEHFGLKKRLFCVNAIGPAVFVGPQTAKTMAALKKLLDTPDAVVTVTGEAGVGKTTLVARALGAIGTNQIILRLGRIKLGQDEVLEFLLNGLGLERLRPGTIQKFSTFRRLLSALDDKNTHVFIIVEDATRIGADTLSELEALTAADAGVSDGANIVLMGDQSLQELMRVPQLARLKQRIRGRRVIEALSANELVAYLKHCFRVAEGDYDTVFTDGAAEILHELSGGVPRIVNNLVETILTSAADEKLDRVDPVFITRIASDECGMSVRLPVLSESALAPADVLSRPDAVVSPMVKTTHPPLSNDEVEAPAPVLSNATLAKNSSMPIEARAAEAAVTSAPIAESDGEEPAAELIHDTLPNLTILAPELVAMATASHAERDSAPDRMSKDKVATEPVSIDSDTPQTEAQQINEAKPDTPDFDDDDIPTLSNSMRLEHLIDPVTTQDASEDPPAEPVLEVEHKSPMLAVIESEPELSVPTESTESPVNESAATDSEEELAEWDRGLTEAVIESGPKLVIATESTESPRNESAATDSQEESAEWDRGLTEAVIASEPKLVIATESTELPGNESAATDSEKDIAEWDRDPTLAQLKPDVEALERAMAISHGDEQIAGSGADAANDKQENLPVAAPTETAEVIPAITLDLQIQAKIDEATELLEQTGIDLFEVASAREESVADSKRATAAPKPEKDLRQNASQESDTEMNKIVAGLGKARTIEDVDDRMAETLFGDEINLIAAQIIANPPPDVSADDELKVIEDKPRVAVASPASQDKSVSGIEPDSGFKANGQNEHAGPSATQRLATVRRLNGNFDSAPFPTESVVLAEEKPIRLPPLASKPPAPIESQIDTSITQTLKALNVPPPEFADDDDVDDDDRKSGFFSRFRRS